MLGQLGLIDSRGKLLRGEEALRLLTNLLAPGTGSVEVFLRVALDLPRTAPPSGNFVTELAQSGLERTGRSGKEAAEVAARSTRDRKEIHSPGEVMAAHRKLAADFGHQAEAVVRAARDRSQHQVKSVNSFERVRESLTFSRDKNFEREAVVDERALIRDGLRRGMGEITHAQVRANLDTRLASGEFKIVEHSSQGLTAERVLIHADTSVHPDLLSSRFAYVSISRASHEATLFTDDMAKLGPQLGADVSKTSALEINQASSVAQGIGLGL